MSTVNFSVPEEVKLAFDAAFSGRNKSAIIAGLMREAVERDLRRQRGESAYLSIVRRRKRAPSITEKQFRAAREKDRP